MGRSERRLNERRNRIESRKDKVLLSKEAINKMKEEITESASSFNVEALMTCFALTEYKLYGFKKKRLVRSLQHIDDLMEPIISGEKTIEDYKQELKNEVGLVIEC